MNKLAKEIIANCELVRDSKDWRDYERAKSYIRDYHPNLVYYRYHKVIELIADYLGV